MTGSIQIAPLDRDVWRTVVDQVADPVSPFQLPEWLDYQLASIPRAFDASLQFRMCDGSVAALPLVGLRHALGRVSYWSLAHDEYGGLLTSRRLQHSELEWIYEWLARERRPVRVTTGPSSIAEGWQPPVPWRSHHYSSHVVVLPLSYDQWFDGMAKTSGRRDIRRASRSNLNVSRARSERDLESYYEVYQSSTARWGKAAKPRAYFSGLLACPLARLYIVYSGERPAAGMIVLVSRDSAFYYLGATNLDFSAACPADLGIAEVVRDCIAFGCRTLNLGGSLGRPELERFKEKFGAQKQQFRSDYVPTPATLLAEYSRYYRMRLAQRARSLAASLRSSERSPRETPADRR